MLWVITIQLNIIYKTEYYYNIIIAYHVHVQHYIQNIVYNIIIGYYVRVRYYNIQNIAYNAMFSVRRTLGRRTLIRAGTKP